MGGRRRGRSRAFGARVKREEGHIHTCSKVEGMIQLVILPVTIIEHATAPRHHWEFRAIELMILPVVVLEVDSGGRFIIGGHLGKGYRVDGIRGVLQILVGDSYSDWLW